MNNLKQTLFNRLEKNGIEESAAKGFLRNLANSYVINPGMNLAQVQRQLRYLGWNDFDLDYHTWQLAIEYFTPVECQS